MYVYVLQKTNSYACNLYDSQLVASRKSLFVQKKLWKQVKQEVFSRLLFDRKGDKDMLLCFVVVVDLRRKLDNCRYMSKYVLSLYTITLTYFYILFVCFMHLEASLLQGKFE